MTSASSKALNYPVFLDLDAIKAVIPHREPMLFAKTVTVHAHNRYEGTASWEANSLMLQGHFPGLPIVPGVAIIEAAAQIAAAGMRTGDVRAINAADGNVGVLMAVRKCMFRRPVFPGVELRFELESRRMGDNLVNTEGTASDSKGIVANLEFAFSQIPQAKLIQDA